MNVRHIGRGSEKPRIEPQVPHDGGVHGNIIFIPTSSQRAYSRKTVKNYDKSGNSNRRSKT